MKTMDKELKWLAGKFGVAYDYLYNATDPEYTGEHIEPEEYQILVNIGDKVMEENPDFVEKLAEARHDCAVSDREVAALAMTWLYWDAVKKQGKIHGKEGISMNL